MYINNWLARFTFRHSRHGGAALHKNPYNLVGAGALCILSGVTHLQRHTAFSANQVVPSQGRVMQHSVCLLAARHCSSTAKATCALCTRQCEHADYAEKLTVRLASICLSSWHRCCSDLGHSSDKPSATVPRSGSSSNGRFCRSVPSLSRSLTFSL